MLPLQGYSYVFGTLAFILFLLFYLYVISKIEKGDILYLLGSIIFAVTIFLKITPIFFLISEYSIFLGVGFILVSKKFWRVKIISICVPVVINYLLKFLMYSI